MDNVNMEVPHDDRERMLEILSYWHRIEFFIPFNLDDVLDEANDEDVRWLYADDLQKALQASIKMHLNGSMEDLVHCDLYLGIFDKGSANAICDSLIKQDSSTEDLFDEQERADREGRSCFSKLRLGSNFELQLFSVSVSTMPWAIGQLRKGSLESLSDQSFHNAKCRLADLLVNFQAARSASIRHQEENLEGRQFTGQELLRLHSLFCDWAGYTPDPSQPIALVKLQRQRRDSAASRLKTAGDVRGDSEPESCNDSSGNESNGAEEETVEPEIDILNSFFITDIERAIRHIRANSGPVIPLAAYLTPLPADQRIDLFSKKGRIEILKALNPAKFSFGHWLSDPTKCISLMQQFAVSQAFQVAAGGGIFAVNGPPGTGKTTLLRDGSQRLSFGVPARCRGFPPLPKHSQRS